VSKKTRVIDGLQMLRGVAATLVVFYHLQAAARAEGFSPGLLEWFVQGEAGVDVFFVLSGFVIFYSSLGQETRGARQFLLQRFWRIFPPYWAVLIATLLALSASGLLLGQWKELPGFPELVISALLLPLPDQVMIVAWTLTIEGVFYLLFAASFFRFGLRGAVAALAVWALIAQVLRFVSSDLPPELGLIMYSGVVEFLFGGLIALAIAAGWQRYARTCVLVGTVGLVAVVSGQLSFHWGREWVAGLPAAALVYGLAAGAWRMPNWSLVWGESSYILYLVHILVFSTAGTLLRMQGIEPYGSLQAMLALALLAVTVSLIATIWVERPYRQWVRMRSRSAQPMTRSVAPAPSSLPPD
jgi:exopolysaccharide production protein ExoZ